MVPISSPDGVHLVKLRQAVDVRAPAEVVDDEALHAGRHGRVEHGGLVADAGWSDDADGCVLAAEGLREGLGCVGGSDDGDAGREGGRRVGAGDDGYVVACLGECCCDWGAEVSGRLGEMVSMLYCFSVLMGGLTPKMATFLTVDMFRGIIEVMLSSSECDRSSELATLDILFCNRGVDMLTTTKEGLSCNWKRKSVQFGFSRTINNFVHSTTTSSLSANLRNSANCREREWNSASRDVILRLHSQVNQSAIGTMSQD